MSDPKHVERYARAIIRHADDLAEMIENVLAAAGSGKRKPKAEETAVPVLETIDRAIDAASAEIEASGCEVDLQIAPDLPPFWGDPAALRRVFQNLVSNAARHGAEGRWIGVSAALAGGKLEVRVADRGPGIDPAEEPYLFEPFWRGERAKLDRVRGTGLGLSLVKEIVEAHGGSIRLVNSTGEGTVFAVILPAATSDQCDDFTNPAG